ncbi:hypothetical protein [Pedobacter sp. SYSU D00535]|uniref:hypothetical protein n=1 Tax=Pedobacter sp. SYSU D00535 TaxID=2810308 RepID=UPI001A97AC0F|nr:hypothetical protein [Pedobacter sp. SYSU D00535]
MTHAPKSLQRLLQRGVFALLLLVTSVATCQADDCEEFGIDPNDPEFCGGGNPDETAPLDDGAIYLVLLGGIAGVYVISRQRNGRMARVGRK